MEKQIIFEGKEKRIYSADGEDRIIIHYKDMTTAFGGIKQALLKGKGKYSCRISAMLFSALEKEGIRTHFLSLLSDREQLCLRLEPIPLQLVVRNRIAGSTAKMLGVENGLKIPNTLLEFRYNCDELGDPMINEDHAVALGIATYEELSQMRAIALKTDEILKELYHRAGIELIDFKLEFARDADGCLRISDELSPDNSRLWDEADGRVLDKDRFRFDMSEVCSSYREVMERLEKTIKQ